jgi:hypothetical protein
MVGRKSASRTSNLRIYLHRPVQKLPVVRMALGPVDSIPDRTFSVLAGARRSFLEAAVNPAIFITCCMLILSNPTPP